jgi:membrane protease YdiL (CAAX protease family)
MGEFKNTLRANSTEEIALILSFVCKILVGKYLILEIIVQYFSTDLTPLLTSLKFYPAVIKIGLFLLAWVLLWLPIAIPLGKFLQWNPLNSPTPQQKLPLLASLYLFVPMMIWLTLPIENLSLADYGLVWNGEILRSLLVGLMLGLGGLGLIFGMESLFGWVKWQNQHFTRLISLSIPLLLLGLWVGLTEEALFRGVFLTQLQQDYSFWGAAIISSILFALLHLLWERSATIPQLPGLFLMGIILVIARWADSGNLGLAWGLHAAWVWGLASLDGAELLTYPESSPDWGVGIGKQPLAGMAGIGCLLVTGLVLWKLFAERVI